MSTTKKKRRRPITDPNIPVLKVNPSYGYSELHNQVVALLASLIHKAGFRVNYAHADTTTPKDKTLPLFLEYKGVKGHAEICFEYNNTHYVFIDLLVINKNLLRRPDENGQNREKA